ncbi:MAG: RIP metalloprotease RseP [Candidatus Harrisonbacteria bacterium RIFCSPLOWO2_02_FULL_41_11]|nr:MAG: RIP metalloprotease RseP [Candidatus Harrisonbacteria bacterium RIFCSPLOWO2_02_FULL_41_11]
MQTLIAGLLVFTVVVSFHEFCHLLAAKWFGVKVKVYSIGFWKRIVWKRFGDTEYRISILPIGGYVRLAGEEGASDKDKGEDKNELPERLFSNKSAWQRFLIAAAGPASNYLLAFTLFAGVYFFHGLPVDNTYIAVAENFPAMNAGLKNEDRIITVNGRAVSSWNQLRVAITEFGGQVLLIEIERDKEVLSLKVKPEFHESAKRWVIGIQPIQKYGNVYNFKESVMNGAKDIYAFTVITIKGIANIILGKISAKENLGGPITVVQMSGSVAKLGFYNFAYWIGIISLSIGFFNFLPWPPLDGGHMAFNLLEIVMGRPLNQEIKIMAFNFGILLLIMLFFFTIYVDLGRLFGF